MISFHTQVKQLIIRINQANFFNYFGFSIINAVISFVTIFVLAKYLSPGEYGKFGILMTILYFTPSILTFSTDSLQSVYLITLDDKRYVTYRNHYISFVIYIFSTLFFVSLVFIFNEFLFAIILFSLIIGLLQWISSVHSIELIQKSESKAYGMLNSITSIFLFAFSILLLELVSKSWFARAFAILLAELLVVIIRLLFFSDLLKKFKFRLDKITMVEFLKFGFPLLLTVIPGWILNQLDKYILLHFFDYKVIGYYTFAASVAGVVVLISQSIQKSLRPFFFKELYLNDNLRRFRKILVYYSLGLIVFGLFFYKIVEIMFSYFPDFKYSDSKGLVFFAIMSQVFFSLYAVFVMVLEFYKLNRKKSEAIWISATIFVLLNVVLSGRFTFYSPAISTLLAFILLSLLTFYRVKKYL